MIIPVVTADIDPGALEDLIVLCVRYHAIRAQPPAPPNPQTSSRDPADTPEPSAARGPPIPPGLIGAAARRAHQAAAAAAPCRLEQQILAKVLQVVSGPGGVASFLRRKLLGKGLTARRCRWMSARPTTSRSPAAAGGAARPEVPVSQRL